MYEVPTIYLTTALCKLKFSPQIDFFCLSNLIRIYTNLTLMQGTLMHLLYLWQIKNSTASPFQSQSNQKNNSRPDQRHFSSSRLANTELLSLITVLQIFVQPPHLLPKAALLTLPSDPNHKHPFHAKLDILISRVSGKIVSERFFCWHYRHFKFVVGRNEDSVSIKNKREKMVWIL